MSDQPTPPARSGKPAGWYKDPSGKYDWRYFDGRWTDDVANEGDDETYTDPVPSRTPPRSAAAGPPGYWQASDGKWYPPQGQAAAPPDVPPQRRKRGGCFKWFGIGILAIIALSVIAVIAGRGSDDDDTGGDSPEVQPAADTGGAAQDADQSDTAAASGAAGDADEVDDVGPCTLVDSETIRLDVTNNSSEQSSYMIDVNFLDESGQRVADETFFVSYARPGERALEEAFAFSATGASGCEIAEVDRVSAESPDDVSEVTCEVTGVDALGDISTSLVATNGSSELSDYLITAALVRDVRIGTVNAVIENVPPGESAPGAGLSLVDGPADGVSCAVIYVQRTSSE